MIVNRALASGVVVFMMVAITQTAFAADNSTARLDDLEQTYRQTLAADPNDPVATMQLVLTLRAQAQNLLASDNPDDQAEGKAKLEEIVASRPGSMSLVDSAMASNALSEDFALLLLAKGEALVQTSVESEDIEKGINALKQANEELGDKQDLQMIEDYKELNDLRAEALLMTSLGLLVLGEKNLAKAWIGGALGFFDSSTPHGQMPPALGAEFSRVLKLMIDGYPQDVDFHIMNEKLNILIATADGPASLGQLAKDLQAVNADMKDKLANFDKAGSTVTTGKENVAGMLLNVTTYKDKDGNILKVYEDPNGNDAQVKLISSGNGLVLTIDFNPDGSIAKEETFQPFGLKKETITYNSDGTKTVVVQDASLTANNTLTYQEDKNGNEVPGSKTLSTTPGLPSGAVYCQTTGQYQEAKPA